MFFYEITDASGDEVFYPLGLFLSLGAAIAEVQTWEAPLCLEPEDSARVEIKARALGMSGNGEVVWVRTWEQNWEDSGKWEVFETWDKCQGGKAPL